ncbi:Lipoteichoic acid synthase 1 [Bacteroidales bacterium Barb4]|nr:Lipoteichoic acid synthase 1 [Bacteroidales bacterium Barb4]
MKNRLGLTTALFIAWLPVFALQKPVFMLFHRALAEGTTVKDWAAVVLHGLRLDATTAGYLTTVPLLLALVSVWVAGEWLRKALRWYLAVVATVVSAVFAVDMGLYGFWGFRLDTTVFFYLHSSFKDAMAGVPVGMFAGLFLVFLLYAYGIYVFLDRLILSRITLKTCGTVGQKIGGTLLLIVLGGLMFIPIRGGITTSTANVGMVYFSQNRFLNHAAINPCFSLMTSLGKQQDFAAQFDFFEEKERAAIFETLVSSPAEAAYPERSLLNTTRPDILLILLESFSANVIEVTGGIPDVTPELNRLSKEGILFTNMYANSFRTDRGVVSVLNGYPAQPTTSVMKYPAKSQSLPSLAKSLGKYGYAADMLYGGDINFTNMQSYLYNSGYGRITADRDFSLSDRLSKWGANDDVTFTRLYQSFKEKKDTVPRFCTFLTLSSHEPFEVPYRRLEHPYLNSVAFTDSCLGSFIGKMKELPVWDNLLIVLISDHGFRYPESLQEYEAERYRIPMLWLGGAIKEPKVTDTFANQTDLAVTLLHQTGIPCGEFAFGKDIFDPACPHYAFYTYNNGFGFIDSTGISVYDNEGEKVLTETAEAAGESSLLRVQKGKALLQTLYDDLGGR